METVDTSIVRGQATPVQTDTVAPATSEPTSSQETSEVPADAGDTEDKLYAGKYKSPDELENAYQELQRHNTKVEMERAELRRSAPQAPDQTGQLLGDQEALSLLNRLIDDRVRPLKEKAELNDMFTRFKDFGDYATKVADEIRKAPNLAWEQAYKIVKFDDRAKEAREEGKKEAYAKIDEKTRAAVAPPSKKQPSRPIGEVVTDRSIPLKEIEKMLPHS